MARIGRFSKKLRGIEVVLWQDEDAPADLTVTIEAENRRRAGRHLQYHARKDHNRRRAGRHLQRVRRISGGDAMRAVATVAVQGVICNDRRRAGHHLQHVDRVIKRVDHPTVAVQGVIYNGYRSDVPRRNSPCRASSATDRAVIDGHVYAV